MRFYPAFIIMLIALTLSACNFSLASDIAPPPDYVSPTPMPTLGSLVPASSLDVQNGAEIFAQNCAPCHGTKGLGDGPQSMQLPVPVPGVGLSEVARSASLAGWFKVVTQGNLDRFMPPFVGALSDQERWNVIAYVLTLHTTPEQVAQGKVLFEAGCPNCAGKFADQSKMAALSEDDLVSIIRNGEGDVPAFGKSLTDDQVYAVAAYLRTLTFATSLAVPATTPGAPTASTAAVEAASTAGAQGTPAAGMGTVSGQVVMAAGNLPANLQVTLHGFDHAQDQTTGQTTGPQEVLTLVTTAAADGSYIFQNVPMPENRVFLAEVGYGGLKFRSPFNTAKANVTEMALQPVKLYEKSDDLSLLRLDQVHIYTDFATSGTVQVLEIFAFSNPSNQSVVISKDGTSIPFITLPQNAQNVGYEAGQDSAPFIAADKGLAVTPSDLPYSIIAFFNLPYDKRLDLSQPFAIDAPSVILLVPDGMNAAGNNLMDKGVQVIQNNNYHEFAITNLKAGGMLNLSVSGQPRNSSATVVDPRQGILIGSGVLGGLLIIAGIFLYVRDRRRDLHEPSLAEFESAEEVMDAILALDDLHRANKIADEAYRNRRAELKEILSNLGLIQRAEN